MAYKNQEEWLLFLCSILLICKLRGCIHVLVSLKDASFVDEKHKIVKYVFLGIENCILSVAGISTKQGKRLINEYGCRMIQ